MLGNKIELPTKMTQPIDDIALVTMLLYGPPKVGKTTIANSFPDVLFVAAEEGLKWQSAYKVGIGCWEDFMELRKKLVTEKHRFKTIAIDTASALFKLCEDYVCRKHGIDHPSDEEWGKGWGFLRDSFHKEMVPLTKPDTRGRIRFGVLFTAHSRDVEVRGRITKTKRVQADLTGTARKVLMPMVDVIGYCGFRIDKSGEPTEDRTVTFKPSEQVEAGDRTGRLPESIDMKADGWYDSLQREFAGRKAPKRKPKRHA